ncbi:MAG TPA: ribonuclease J [Propioniciclava sp.]|uniref:ribonuclease J n=1 Tax=Propioniciclava sp. TaxID=2038686 RepID=UPI002CAC4F3B|nr:ribonuclease J [Propioniciclava sp.]HRL49051.1 ribonuclease J [Propioniciclava sp.]HRL79693.1 ribonuclease J [Propioniciclava sp.]
MREPLQTPPKLRPDTLRITPLGGLGDVGRNSASFEINGQRMILDCGVLFPDENHPGVDLILPSLHLLGDNLDDISCLVLTHGHEDHIGAVPYLLRRRPDIPVLGSRLTLAFLREKLKEHRLRHADLREMEAGSRTTIGEFDLEFLAVNHSIPDALAVLVRTSAGTVLHTGDFKMDQLPLDGRLTDLRGFAKAGEEGVDLFMVDSTNAETPGFTTHEIDIQPAMERVFSHASARLIVACFSSHVHRVQQVMDEAVKSGRKVVYVGRSMVKNMTIAAQLGYLKVPANTLIALDDIDKYASKDVVIVSTGSQGEPLSALSRIANHEHPVITAGPGDVVLLASSLIPGNENSVSRVINGLTRNGVKVVHKGNALVHVSGHASSGELLYCYNLVKPRNVMPVHGEIRHLHANAELAIATGVPRENALVVEDGTVVDLHDGAIRVVGRVEADYVFVDGSTVDAVGDAELDDRRILGEEGFISAIAVVNLHTGELVEGPIITARGFIDEEGIFDAISAEVAGVLREALADGAEDTYPLQQLMRRRLGRWVSKRYRARPMIVPVVLAT